ncbi:MAG: hypothetical protein AAF941_06465 [Pseudomonadota bacterium]
MAGRITRARAVTDAIGRDGLAGVETVAAGAADCVISNREAPKLTPDR